MDDSNFSSSDGSDDVIVCSESNVITIDVDLSTKESVINVGTQTNIVPYCRCEEAIAAITRPTHLVQTLSSRVDTSIERLTGQLNVALYAIISHRSQVLIFIIVKIIHVNVHTKIGTCTCKTDKCMYTFIFYCFFRYQHLLQCVLQ